MKLCLLAFAVVLLATSQVFCEDKVTFGEAGVAANDGDASSKAKSGIQGDIAPRAPSSFENCDCQCDPYIWTDGRTTYGNCRSPDKTGALFCYIDSYAAKACSDVKVSAGRVDRNGKKRLYSYEACSTPPRQLCGGFPVPVNQGPNHGGGAGGAGGAGGYGPPGQGGVSISGGAGGYFGTRSNLGEELESGEVAKSTVAPEVFEATGTGNEPADARRR